MGRYSTRALVMQSATYLNMTNASCIAAGQVKDFHGQRRGHAVRSKGAKSKQATAETRSLSVQVSCLRIKKTIRDCDQSCRSIRPYVIMRVSSEGARMDNNATECHSLTSSEKVRLKQALTQKPLHGLDHTLLQPTIRRPLANTLRGCLFEEHG